MTADKKMTEDFDSHSNSDRKSSGAISKYIDIPELLHSVEKDMPFRNCLSCNADLLLSNEHYVIEKVFKRNEVIIEMAMCLNCRESQGEDGLSKKSAESMQSFLTTKIDFHSRLNLMSQVSDSESIDPWLERCLLSDQPSQIFSEYQIVALCKGPWLQRDFYPALISGIAIEEMADLLSEETRDWMDDFVGENFGMPSEFCSPPSVSPLLL